MSREDIKKRHEKAIHDATGFTYCKGCSNPWPCDAAKLVAKLEAVEKETEHGGHRPNAASDCHLCRILAIVRKP